jgi:hypothetical protein
MSWTQFTARMKDGKAFEFGTMYEREFFDMPEAYAGSDITLITPAELGTRFKRGVPIFREKPYFECYVDGL